jgi:flavorubredoxin
MPVDLYNDGRHICLGFYDLVEEGYDHAVQANQFLIVDNGQGALIDPGGNMTYSGLLMAMQKLLPSKDLKYILASHADPDILGSLNKWFVGTNCQVVISRIWTRFIPHLTSGKDVAGRILGVPDEGTEIGIGNAIIKALPAHFLHSEGNFQFYDPVSKILFSGDLGTSLVPKELAAEPVRDFDAHMRFMAGFHRRYMGSNKVCRLWANMVRELDIEMIVPQHGSRIVGKPMVARFIEWVENLSCGIDLVTQENYRIPGAPVDGPSW